MKWLLKVSWIVKYESHVFPRGSCLVFYNSTLESHNYSWHQILIRGLRIERLWTVCGFAIPRLVSHGRVFYHRLDCFCVGDGFCERIKDEKKLQKRKQKGRKNGGKRLKGEGRKGGGKCVVGGADMFCSPGVFFSLPPSVSPPPPPSSRWPWLGGMCSLFCVRRKRGGGGKKERGTHPLFNPTYTSSFLHCLSVPRDKLRLRNEDI